MAEMSFLRHSVVTEAGNLPNGKYSWILVYLLFTQNKVIPQAVKSLIHVCTYQSVWYTRHDPYVGHRAFSWLTPRLYHSHSVLMVTKRQNWPPLLRGRLTQIW